MRAAMMLVVQAVAVITVRPLAAARVAAIRGGDPVGLAYRRTAVVIRARGFAVRKWSYQQLQDQQYRRQQPRCGSPCHRKNRTRKPEDHNLDLCGPAGAGSISIGQAGGFAVPGAGTDDACQRGGVWRRGRGRQVCGGTHNVYYVKNPEGAVVATLVELWAT